VKKGAQPNSLPPPSGGGGVTPFMRRSGQAPRSLPVSMPTPHEEAPQKLTGAPPSEENSKTEPVYSQIKGLNDQDREFGDDYATHLSHGLVDIRRETRSKTLLFVTVVLIAGFVGLLAVSPNFRQRVLGQFEFVTDAYNWLVRHRQGQRKISSLADESRDSKGQSSSTVSDKFKLHQLNMAKESDLNKLPFTKNELGTRYVTQVYDDLMQGRIASAERLVKDRCRVWQQSNTCVAKLLVLSSQRRVPGLLRDTSFLFKSEGQLAPLVQTYLLYAGGVVAHMEGQMTISDQRLRRAMSIVPKSAGGLKQDIALRSSIIYLSRGELLAAKRAVNTVSSPNASLALVESLIRPGQKVTQLKRIFAAEKTLETLRAHPELIDLLGAEAFRQNMASDFAKLTERLEKTRGVSKDVRKAARQWQIRGLISKGNGEKARMLLANYGREFGDDSWVNHFDGIALLAQSQGREQATAAAMKFQDALRSGRQWESLWALGYALIRAERPEEVGPVLAELERLMQAQGQRYWVDLLKAEWYLATDKYLSAQKIMTSWRKKAPERQGPVRLSIGLYKKMGKKTELKMEELALKDLGKKGAYWASPEGLASPLGFMALGIRPLID